VAASAAVPVVFAPVVIKTFPKQCNSTLPDWIVRARSDQHAPPLLKAFAQAITRYHSGAMPYIKLLDGGLVDNFGLSGFTIARLSSTTAYGPLTPQQAVQLRRVLFLVVDAGRSPSGNWVQTVAGPGGIELMMAAADTAIDASVRASYTAFEATFAQWQQQLIRWRCGLSAAERKRYGAPANWSCRNLKFLVDRVSFEEFSGDEATRLNAVPTRFTLPAAQVDMVIAAGAEALRRNRTYQAFLAETGSPAAPRTGKLHAAEAGASR
jgi:NTE family protein